MTAAQPSDSAATGRSNRSPASSSEPGGVTQAATAAQIAAALRADQLGQPPVVATAYAAKYLEYPTADLSLPGAAFPVRSTVTLALTMAGPAEAGRRALPGRGKDSRRHTGKRRDRRRRPARHRGRPHEPGLRGVYGGLRGMDLRPYDIPVPRRTPGVPDADATHRDQHRGPGPSRRQRRPSAPRVAAIPCGRSVSPCGNAERVEIVRLLGVMQFLRGFGLRSS